MTHDADADANPQDVERLYRELGPALLGYARSVTGSAAAAQDVLQQVFLRLLDRPTPLPREPRPYLYRAVRNAALNLRRTADRDERRHRALPAFDAPDGSEDAARSLEEALDALPAEQRRVVMLKVWGGLTIEQAAEVEGIPANTAGSRYRYALARLRQRMGAGRRP